MADLVTPPPDISVDTTQFTDQSSPDTGMPLDVSGSSGSGDTYAPQGGTNLPFVPSEQTGSSFVGMHINDVLKQQTAPAQGQSQQPQSFVGMNISDVMKAQQTKLPQPVAATKPGRPAPNYGNDLAGQALRAESQLPGGEGPQAFIHGAQSQVLPGLAGLGAAVGAGALVGSVVPGAGTAVGAVVGLIAGLGGYWLGSQAQDTATKALVPEQTRAAYAAQTAYEQQTQPIWYGVGELAPQFAAFKPNPKAIMGAFKLAGSINAAPVAEKLATFSGPKLGPSLAEQLAFREHQDAVNQLLMMGFGSAYTAYQAKQQVDAGNVQPLILAANLIGATLLSKPRWIKDVNPALRPGVEDSSQKGADSFVAGAGEQSPDFAKAWQDHNDAIKTGDQALIEKTQAALDAAQAARRAPQEPPVEQPAAQAEAMPRTPDVIAQELIDTINSARTPEEKLRLAQEADAIAERQRIPNWESQVARLKTEDKNQLQAQTQSIKGLAENPAFPRESAPSQFDQKAFAQAVAKLHKANPETKTWTDDELKASIAANQAATLADTQQRLGLMRKEGGLPSPEEQLAKSGELPQHTKDVMRKLREGESTPLEEVVPTQAQPQQQAGTGNWVRVSVPEKVAQELAVTQSERFSQTNTTDPYYGSVRKFETKGGKVILEIRPDQLNSIRSQLRDDYHPTEGLGRDENGKRDPNSAAARNASAMRKLADQLQKLENSQGENNGIQQEAAGVGQEAGQISRSGETGIPPQGVNPGEVGQQTNPTGVTPNPTEALNATGSSTGGNGNAEAGAYGTPTVGTGIIRSNAGNESGPAGATPNAGEPNAATGNESWNAAPANAATAGGNAEATINPTGNIPADQRGTAYGEQPATGTTESGTVNRGLNASAADPAVIKATADSIRAHLKQPGYIATPEEQTLLNVLDNQVREQKQSSNPRPWPVTDPRLPETIDKNLLNKTFKAVTQVQPVEGEGGRAYAERVVKATGVYQSLDHALEVAKGARDGFVQLTQTPDGKVGFTVDGKLYKGTPSTHVANWDKGFGGVVHSILDAIPNEVLATEPKDQSPLPMDIQQVRSSFAGQFQPHVEGSPLDEFKVQGQPQQRQETAPPMSPHDFAMSPHAADTPSIELNSSSAGNKVKAGITQVQENIDLVNELSTHGFDPAPVQQKFGELEQAAGGGSGLPPKPPSGGGNGEEPPKTPGDRKAASELAPMAKTQKLEDNYLDALKQGLLTDDPAQKRMHAGINDILSSVMRTFDINLWQKHPRVQAKEASDAAKMFATYYKKINDQDIKPRLAALEKLNPGAEANIRAVFTAGDEVRPGLLAQMTADEAAIANHLHTYWQLLGDILTRAGVIKSALEDYFPLIADKNVFAKGEFYAKGNVVEHNGRLYVAKNDISKATSSPILDAKNWASKPESQRLAARSKHSIARQLKDEDGDLMFRTPEELQTWSDEKGLGWKIKTDIGDVFEAQGASVIKALVMKHTVDQMMHNEFELNKYGESAPAILNQQMMDNHRVALDNSAQYVKSDKVIGPWRSALTRPKWVGTQQVPESLWIRKDLAEQFSREASFTEMGDNPIVRVMRWLNNVNNYWKVFKFALTPMHAYSMLGNVSAHTGFAGTYGVVRRGAEITNNPAFRSRFMELVKASGSIESTGEGLGGPHSILNNLPGIGKIFKWQEHGMWKTIGYNSLFGLGDKLSNDYMAWMAVKHPEEMVSRFDADKHGMDAAKKAVGYLDQLDMSKNYQLGANVLLLANRWTTGQLRTMGEAFGLKRLANIGNPVPMEGSSARASEFMQRRQIEMSRNLIRGGMLRLLLVGTAMTTIISALHNNGVPSTPWDNFQKDPAHTFDIYTGRDPVTNKDTWVHMPFYLFQREMVDWAMAAVKAQEQGKEFIDPKNLGDSVLTAPFVRFAGKMNPVTKTSLEVATGQEIGQWMRGYDKAGIDSDQYIVNLNKSLQTLGIPDQGSLENRLLYAMKNLLPGINYPQNLPGVTSDPGAVLSALAGLPFGGNENNVELGFIGSRIDQGQTFTPGPDGQMIPTWQNKQLQDQKTQIGQDILTIASTLGTGTAEEITQKLSQMEGLRQQGGFTPGQLVQLVEYGAGHNTGGKGLLYQNLPPKTQMTPAFTVINGYKLSPQEDVTYQGIKFQHEAYAIGQLMSDSGWKNMQISERSAAVNSAKLFVDKITNEQVSISLGLKKGNPVTTAQANQMISSYGTLSKNAQANLQNSALFVAAPPEQQKLMLADRVSAAETAVWDKNFGMGVLKNASDAQMMQYVQVHSGVRDEVRQLVSNLPSYAKSQNPQSQSIMLASGLKFADTLVNQATSGKTLKTFDSPMTQQQISLAVKNGIVLQDAAVRELHNSFIYQEAPTVDQGLLDQKYTNLAHNIALYDMRQGITSQPATAMGFDAALRTTLAADEGYQSLVEQYFGIGGIQVLKTKEAELNDLKTRFKQEHAIRPADLAKYDTMINQWYDQRNPDYAQFRHARTFWEANDPVGQAYRAVSQSNLGFEAADPLALATS